MHLLAQLKLLLLPLAAMAWWPLRHVRSGWSWWSGMQVWLAIATEGIAWMLALSQRANTLVYNLYMPLEFVLLSAVVVHVGGGRRPLRNQAWLGGALFAIAYAWDAAERPIALELLTNALVIGSFVLAVLAGLGLYRMVDGLGDPLPRRAGFWALLAIVTAGLAMVPLLGLYNYLHEHNADLADRVYGLNDVLFVLRYAMVAWSFVLLRRQQGDRTWSRG